MEYHFISTHVFERMVLRGEFLEWARFPPETGNFYGTALSEISEEKDTILEIDIQGVQQVRAAFPKATTIFVKASMETLRRRMIERDGLSLETEVRLARAAEEIKEAQDIYEHFIDNEDGDAARQSAAYKLLDIVRHR